MSDELKNHIRSLSLEQLKTRLGYTKEHLDHENKALNRMEQKAEEYLSYGWGRSYPVEYLPTVRRVCELQDEINFINAEIALR